IVWWAAVTGRPILSGVGAAAAAAIKLFPGLLFAWFVFASNSRAARAFVISAAGLLIATIFGAGIDNTLAYLHVISQTGAEGPTPLSLPGLAEQVGAPNWMVAALPAAVMVIALAVAFACRRNPGL